MSILLLLTAREADRDLSHACCMLYPVYYTGYPVHSTGNPLYQFVVMLNKLRAVPGAFENMHDHGIIRRKRLWKYIESLKLIDHSV